MFRSSLNSWQYTSTTLDMSIVSLNIEGASFYIYNLYSQLLGSYRNTAYETLISRLLELLVGPREHIVLGDLNLHYPRWNGP
jgi:hypothetical protein